MVKLILDFSKVKYFSDIHKVIKDTFKFPDHYGENLDALWDCMRDCCEYKLHVTVSGINHFSNEWKEYMQEVFDVFNDIHKECKDFTYEILVT